MISSSGGNFIDVDAPCPFSNLDDGIDGALSKGVSIAPLVLFGFWDVVVAVEEAMQEASVLEIGQEVK